MSSAGIDYADVQGTVLRGYRVDLARHFVLRVTGAAGARAFLGKLVDGTGGVPKLTTAARWTEKPECFVNVGFSAAGLKELGIAAAELATFDMAFQRGAASPQTASIVGDVGESAPENWIGCLGDAGAVHVVLNLWVHEDPAVLETVTERLCAAFKGAFEVLSTHDARALPDNRVHFGYRDNIAQPTVIGAPPRKCPVPDDQPAVATGEFLLGYTNESGFSYAVRPEALSKNASYAAFRILEQDVPGFEAFLAEYAPKAGIEPEALAAKVCGRWRNGNPLMLAPDAPGEPLPVGQLNQFTYVDAADPARDDTLGLVCPIGSHIRRTNPRNEAVTGDPSPFHRIVRRAMPYGPEYDPAQPVDVPRGLIGYFINASLFNQFEFIQGQWALDPGFVKSAIRPGGTSDEGNAAFNISGQDVFLGEDDPSSSSFTLAAPGKNGKNNTSLTGWGRTITTRGSVYCFLPGVAGLRYLASLGGPSPA